MERYCTKCGKLAAKKNDNLYVCTDGHENWINPATGASAYVIRDGKVLFGVRSIDPGKGKLDVPGGFIEVHESAEQAIIRETKEELGIDITLEKCLGTYPSLYDGRPALNIVFIASMAAGQPITPSDDLSAGEPIWCDIESLSETDDLMDVWMDGAHKDLLAWWQEKTLE